MFHLLNVFHKLIPGIGKVKPKHALDGTSARFDAPICLCKSQFFHFHGLELRVRVVRAHVSKTMTRVRVIVLFRMCCMSEVCAGSVCKGGTPCASCISLRVISWASSMRSSATMFMYSSHLCMHHLKPGCFQADKLRSTRLRLSFTAST